MVFLKHFDTSKQTLHGIGKCYAQRNAKISDLISTINERMRWTPGTPLKPEFNLVLSKKQTYNTVLIPCCPSRAYTHHHITLCRWPPRLLNIFAMIL